MTQWIPWIMSVVLLGLVVWMNARKGPRSLPSLPPLSPGAKPLPSLAPPASAGGPSPFLVAMVLAPWGLLAWSHLTPPDAPLDVPPAPVPSPDGWPSLDLRGAFVGETAAQDALTTQYLSESLAAWVAYDGTLKEPRLKTGAAFADLRKSAREGRMEGLTLGARQPIARERIKAFLDAAVGDVGGPDDGTIRPKFVRAMKTVSEKAAAAVGRKP